MAENTPVIRNWRMPMKGKYAYGPKFGIKDSWHPNGHRGTDYNGFKSGTPLLAVADGKIVVNKFSAILGNVIVLQVGGKFFGYCHMVKPSGLKVGTIVKSGDIVGYAGTTGSASSGVHLHLTLGTTDQAVFGGQVYDADAFLKAKIAEEKPIKAALAAAAAAAAPAATPAEGA
jgi:murein DD-endopeptidase MepM/ murein hydrolase activator NlpD